MQKKDSEMRLLCKQVYDNKDLNDFIRTNHLTDQDIERFILPFLSYVNSEKKCENCKGLDSCKQSQKGKKVAIRLHQNQIEAYFTSCEPLENKEKQEENHLKASGYNFKEIENQKIEVTPNRKEVLSLIKTFLNNYEKGLPCKGIYLYGSHGSGKTFLLAYLAKQLSNSGTDVLFLFYPDLVRKVKSYIGTPFLEKAIEELKTVEVLMLDDFGAETCTNFIRDEILGPVLQERMNNHLPTFMTSNLDDECLIEHLSETTKSTEILRSTRIRARIQALMNFVELTGKNYRV